MLLKKGKGAEGQAGLGWEVQLHKNRENDALYSGAQLAVDILINDWIRNGIGEPAGHKARQGGWPAKRTWDPMAVVSKVTTGLQ